MTTNTETQMAYPMDAEEMKYWAHRGPKTAAFLLVIPGCALVGVGVGMVVSQLLPMATIGTGFGFLIWGLVVALSK